MGKFHKLRKISPENFPENRDFFLDEVQCYRARIYLFIFVKTSTIEENFSKNFGEISEMSEIPGGNFSGKFPGNSGCFFQVNAMIQSKNLFFYVYKK